MKPPGYFILLLQKVASFVAKDATFNIIRCHLSLQKMPSFACDVLLLHILSFNETGLRNMASARGCLMFGESVIEHLKQTLFFVGRIVRDSPYHDTSVTVVIYIPGFGTHGWFAVVEE